ncbi:ATP-binding protein [Chitinophaga sp. 212800010-3]|uniref:ATP-binding protein n=1 Tax=unclassified Chitinophaga TaxID=2619133 RepID=UPI002DF28BBA|nr:HAMP domain-containing histidine kinase [Chitinophaga sp. 212800010-3]
MNTGLLTNLSTFRLLTGVLLLLLLLAGCETHSGYPPDHSEYFDQFFQRTDSLEASQALHQLDSTFAVFPNPGPMDLARKYAYKMNHYWSRKRDKKMARLYADSIFYVLKGKTDRPDYGREYGEALLTTGDIMRDEGKFSDAFARYYEGRALIQKSGDTCSFNSYDGRLAMTYYLQKRYREAIPYFEEAFNALSYCKNDPYYGFRIQQGELDNIGLCYYNLNMNDSARFYYDSALHYIQLNEKPFHDKDRHVQFIAEARAVIFGNLGSIFLLQGDTVNAENNFQDNLRITMSGDHDKRNAQQTVAKLIQLKLYQSKYDEARTWLRTLRGMLDTLPYDSSELNWRQLQSKYYAVTGKPDTALAFLQSFVALKDSLTAVNSPLNDLDIQREFGYISKEYELELLRKQNEIKSIYLVVSVLLFAMAAIIAFQIWQYSKRSKKHLTALEQLNKQVTDQNAQMSRSLNALEQSQLDNSRMMKIVAHDLRNPVGAMAGLTEILSLDLDNTSDGTQETLQLMRESGERALSLINELLYLNVTTEMQREPVEMDVVLRYCVNLLLPKAKEKGITIQLYTIPVTFFGNREKIWRVFSNLITNAIKFSRRGSVIDVRMQPEENDMVKISVKDEGIGIPPDIREKIFNLSPDSSRKGTMGEESFGLGLAISKQIVMAHSGRIWFESEEGKGSVFYVELKRG